MTMRNKQGSCGKEWKTQFLLLMPLSNASQRFDIVDNFWIAKSAEKSTMFVGNLARVVDGQDDAGRPFGQGSADGVMRIEVAKHEATTMKTDKG